MLTNIFFREWLSFASSLQPKPGQVWGSKPAEICRKNTVDCKPCFHVSRKITPAANIDALHFESNQDWHFHLLLGLVQTATPAQHSLIPNHATIIAGNFCHLKYGVFEITPYPTRKQHSQVASKYHFKECFLVERQTLPPPQNSVTQFRLRLKIKECHYTGPFFTFFLMALLFNRFACWFKVLGLSFGFRLFEAWGFRL